MMRQKHLKKLTVNQIQSVLKSNKYLREKIASEIKFLRIMENNS